MKKSIFILVISIVLLAALILGIFLFVFNDLGIRSFSARQDSNGDISLKFNYIDVSKYHVCVFDKSEKIYRGEQPVELNSDLGEYVVRINLGDTVMSDKMKSKYSSWITYDLKGVDKNMKFMWCPNVDHGISFYIGCDEPIYVEDKIVDCKDIGTISVTIYTE